MQNGHCDFDSLSLQLAQHEDDGSPLLLVTGNVAASRRDQLYQNRVAFKLDADGKATEWLRPPCSKCECVVCLWYVLEYV